MACACKNKGNNTTSRSVVKNVGTTTFGASSSNHTPRNYGVGRRIIRRDFR